MKEKLTDKQVLEKIEKYMRLTKMPETDYYDISIAPRGRGYAAVGKAPAACPRPAPFIPPAPEG